MNLKAKIEWSHSGERAGASTIGPAQATRLATASCSSSFCHWRSRTLSLSLWRFCPASLLGAPFPRRISLSHAYPQWFWALLRS